MKRLFTVLLLLLVGLPGAGLRAQTLDPTFQPTVLKAPFVGGLQTSPQFTLVQPDGKVLVAGGFDFANGVLASKLIRLNADGTPDATFNPGGTGANGFIGAMALQPDGKLIIVGGFTVYNGAPAFAQARLNTNGTLDASFAALPTMERRQLGSVAVQPDGKILVGGSASLDATPLPAVRRLNANGTPDASFTPPASTTGDFVRTILVQADGRILVGGSGNAGSALSIGLQRLNTDGSLDNGFASPFSTGIIVYALAQQPDGKLLVGGSLAPGGTANPGVVRLQANGQLDNTFATGSGLVSGTSVGSVRALVLLPSGNILVGGPFTQYNGVARGRVVRLLPTGAVDAGFATGAGANNPVTALATTASGQVLAVGNFTQYDGGSARTGLVRLTAAGAEDAAFNSPMLETRGSINSVAPLASGKFLVQGNFTSFNGTPLAGAAGLVRRLNADGTLDQSYSTAFANLYAVQPDGSFYVNYYASPSTSNQLSLGRVLPSGALDNSFASPPYVAAIANSIYGLRGVVVQPDGRVLAFGNFVTYGGVARNGIVRLNTDGTVDNSFVPPAATSTVQRTISNVIVQNSGKIVLTYQEGAVGSPILGNPVLSRLNADGSLDNTFAPGTGPGASDYISVLPQPDGKLLLSGLSSFNGQAAPYGTLRLTADGAVDNTFNQLAATYGPLLVQPDGRILAYTNNSPGAATAYGANSLVRLNSNGSLDGTFGPISTPRTIFTGDNSFNNYLYQPADGKLIAYGSFTLVLGQVRVGLARLVPGVVTATHAAQAAQPLVVYPNPARQQLTVVLPTLAQPTQATLLSLTGQVVRQWALPARQPEATLDLSPVAAGLYVLRIPGPLGVQQQKVVITR